MRIAIFVSLLAFAGAAVAATGSDVTTRGTVIDMPANEGGVSMAPPRRAMTMVQVERRYGAPRSRHNAVGEPPITRWDYPGFSVFFEHNLVLHTVVPDDFPEIRHRDQLR